MVSESLLKQGTAGRLAGQVGQGKHGRVGRQCRQGTIGLAKLAVHAELTGMAKLAWAGWASLRTSAHRRTQARTGAHRRAQARTGAQSADRSPRIAVHGAQSTERNSRWGVCVGGAQLLRGGAQSKTVV